MSSSIRKLAASPVKERVSAIRDFDRGGELDPENNYLFGEGGAGTFSDGKLTCRISGPDVDWVLERLVDCGGKSSIRYEQRPHLGSNRLPMLVRNFRRKIEADFPPDGIKERLLARMAKKE